MHCLVLGGTGFIGSHLVPRLVEMGYEVSVLSRRQARQPFAHVRYLQGDWNDSAVLSTALEGADLVYHFIWGSVPTTSVENFRADLNENVLNSMRLFELCVEKQVQRVIFCSTGGAIYGPADYLPIPEDHPLRPIAPYGVSKLIVEHYLRLFNLKYGLPYLLVRPANAYGIGQNADGVQGAVARFLWCAKNHHPITLYGDGSIIRDYILVDEVAEAFARLAAYSGTQTTFNVGTGQGTSLHELIEMVEHRVGTKLLIQQQPLRWFDAPANILDVSRLHQETGWKPHVDLKTGLEQIIF